MEGYSEEDFHKCALEQLLGDADHPLRQRAYLRPRSVEELALKKSGYYEAEQGRTAFAGGWSDYAHSLLSCWSMQAEEGGYADDPALSAKLVAWHRRLSEQRAVLTAVLHPARPADGGRPALEAGEEGGAMLRAVLPLGQDSWYTDELLVLVQEADEEAPSSVLLLPMVEAGYAAFGPGSVSGVTVTVDRVFVPAERILVFRSPEAAGRLLEDRAAGALADYQWAARQIDSLSLALGAACAWAERTGLDKGLHIQSSLAVSIQELETAKALLHAAEIGASTGPAGFVRPNPLPLAAARQAGGPAYRRALGLLERITGAPGFAESDRSDPLVRLALELAGGEGAFWRRRHEAYAFGDPISQSAGLYRAYPADKLQRRYEQFWQEALADRKVRDERQTIGEGR